MMNFTRPSIAHNKNIFLPSLSIRRCVKYFTSPQTEPRHFRLKLCSQYFN